MSESSGTDEPLSRPSITRDKVTQSDKSDARNRSWVFTMYNEEDVRKIKSLNTLKAMCIGREVCPTTGKEHYQGYVRFDNVVRFTWWKNQFPTVHVEPRKGHEYQAAEYCRKEGDVVVDFGCDGPPRKKFKGDQHEQCANMIANGASQAQVHREMGPRYFYLNCRKIEDYWNKIQAFKLNEEDYLKHDSD